MASENSNEKTNETKRVKGSPVDVRALIAPWWDVSYQEQLHRKETEMVDCTKKLLQQLKLGYKDRSKASSCTYTGDKFRMRCRGYPSPSVSIVPLQRNTSSESNTSTASKQPDWLDNAVGE